MAETNTSEVIVLHDIPPYMKVYSDGRIDRLVATETTAAGLDSQTGVFSKDILILPETAVSARLYHPNPDSPKKLPLLIYFHGGAFLIASAAEPKYHAMLNLLAKQAQIIVVSVDYRLAPENPLPAAYDDSWAALQWAAGGGAGEPWLTELADFDRVFLAGDSAGANICHQMAIKNLRLQEFKISGFVMVHPYFWGEDPIGVEAESPVFKSVVDNWWRFVCPSDLGCDDPLINPFAGGEDFPALARSYGFLVCVAGNDILRERGRLYYKALMEEKGKAEYLETPEEDHVFHIFDPSCENAKNLINKCAEFINSK
ncbi:probable carboxylesterase 2 [Andrographis paniculata]|uniref:probable carboxylesterase 2 n=1 Tax=Andrographis paniculata TaxID=175694 RepID=UPI0021E8BA07|nr:probable carboxylesterase 2 [Andrographis paniculata]